MEVRVYSEGSRHKFDEAHDQFMNGHIQIRRGERARRLQKGHGHAEKLFLDHVWWPAFGHFDHLHPEYEVTDFKDGFRYLDFAYIRPGMQLAIEIDGYGPHLRDISREQFSDQCRRQNDLIIDGWKILRYSYDDIREIPRFCQQKLQQFMGRWLGDEQRSIEADWREKEMIRLFLKHAVPVTPGEVCIHFGVKSKTARKWLQGLMIKGWILPVGGSERIRSYKLNLAGRDYLL